MKETEIVSEDRLKNRDAIVSMFSQENSAMKINTDPSRVVEFSIAKLKQEVSVRSVKNENPVVRAAGDDNDAFVDLSLKIGDCDCDREIELWLLLRRKLEQKFSFAVKHG